MLDRIKSVSLRPSLRGHGRHHPEGAAGPADDYADRLLLFRYDGLAVQHGDHVTEVKAGQFAAFDCGAKPEAWTEIFVQPWNAEQGERTHRGAGTSAKIIRKMSQNVGLDRSAKLTFEVSDGAA